MNITLCRINIVRSTKYCDPPPKSTLVYVGFKYLIQPIFATSLERLSKADYGTYATHLHQLNVLHKTDCTNNFLVITSAFTNISLLNISQILNIQIALFISSYDFNCLPNKFSGFFVSSNNNNTSHFLCNAHEYSPFSKSTPKLFFIQYYGPRLYSSIPSSTKHSIQLHTCPFRLIYLLFKSRTNNIYGMELYSL